MPQIAVYDTKMDVTNTLADGTFKVVGGQNKIRKIDPKINIYHRCNHVGVSFSEKFRLFFKNFTEKILKNFSFARKGLPFMFRRTQLAKDPKKLNFLTLEF